MKKRKAHIPIPARSSGSTLTEVLIGVMVLGIGVISVATLFPIAVLQAVRANHVTQATVLRYNAEAAIHSLDLTNRYIFFGADRLPGTGGGITGWHPGPDGGEGAGGAGPPGDPVSDDYPFWDLTNFLDPDDEEVIMIDPLGFWRMGADTIAETDRATNEPPPRARFFGWSDDSILGGNDDGNFNDPTEVQTMLRRITGGHRGNTPGNNTAGSPNRSYYGAGALWWNYEFPEAVAEQLVTLKDQYITELDAPAFSSAGVLNSVDLANNVDGDPMDDIVNNFLNNSIPVQVVLFDENGNGLVRNVVDTSANKRIDFTPGLPDTDGDTNPDQAIERAVIQAQHSDFTWLLTAKVRSADALPAFDCVVFYKREYSDADEQLFVMRLGEDFGDGAGGPPNGNLDPGEDLDNDGNLDVLNNVLRFSHADINDPTVEKVQIKKGSYLFDAENAEWYGVADIVEQTSTQTTFVIDRPLRDVDGQIAGAFMAGIVDVFPLGRKD